MSDFKSKLPDLQELGNMTSKLFKDVRKSVLEIVGDYKQKRADETTPAKPAGAKKTTTAAKVKKTVKDVEETPKKDEK